MRSEISVEKEHDPALNTLPLGESSFHRLRADGQLYVDKTALIAELLRNRKSFILLTRPYLFGKTLLLSTLEELFKNGLADFNGLAIEKLWHEGTYPVIRLDLKECGSFKCFDGFNMRFLRILKDGMGAAGLKFPKADPVDQDFISSRFKRLLVAASDDTKLVLLIDNYDAPLNSCFNDPELFLKVAAELNSFYSVLQQFSGLFRCIFITGVYKYRELTSLSRSGFIKDVSLYSKYSSLLGFTYDELKLDEFKPYVERAARALKCSYDDCRFKISDYFSWYCFNEEKQAGVYDPISILNFLDEPERSIKSYWIDAVRREPIVKACLSKHVLRSFDAYEGRRKLERDGLEIGCGSFNDDETAFMRATGILSITNVDSNGELFTLYFSSHEVSMFMARLYARQVFGSNFESKVGRSSHFLFKVDSNKEIYDALRLVFGRVDHKQYPIKDEDTLHAAFELYLKSGGVEIEDSTEFLNSDLEFKAGTRYYALKLVISKNWGDGEKKICDVIDDIHKHCFNELDEIEDFCHQYTFIRLVLLYSVEKQQFIDYFTRWAPQRL